MMKPLEIKKNARIASSQVRVIAENGSDLGVYSLTEACRLAQRQVQDLIQIGPNDDPPTCRLVGPAGFYFIACGQKLMARKSSNHAVERTPKAFASKLADRPGLRRKDEG
jgi:translation initiation factor IF-3